MLPVPTERRLRRGDHLFRAGERALGLVVVLNGALELVRFSAEGRRLVLHRAGPGESFAEASLFEKHHHCDAVAAMAAHVHIFAAASLRRVAAGSPELGWRIAAHLAARLVAERARAERLSLPRAVDRLLDALHALPIQPDGKRRLGRPWKTLAAELGLTHEATYRALARMEAAGLVRRESDGAISLAAPGGG